MDLQILSMSTPSKAGQPTSQPPPAGGRAGLLSLAFGRWSVFLSFGIVISDEHG